MPLTAERAIELLQRPFKDDLSRLQWWVDVQDARSRELTDAEVELLFEEWSKIDWSLATDYGDPVTIIWKRSPDCPVDIPEPKNYGYLTTLSGSELDMDVGGIVHIPHTQGEKCDGGPVWASLLELCINPDVKRVIIGV
jgi:hypothetical protein